ncbi:MAG TPA: transcriptional repressor, partial [Alcaligenes faecalis]|nr:transcriptional repressor [Alcaligenes faecalis]
DHGFVLESHTMLLYGICPKCSEAGKQAKPTLRS